MTKVRYFEDLEIDRAFESRARTVTESDIMSFAGLSGDFNPLHTDETWVRANTKYGGRIAHGLLILAITSGLRTPELDDLEILAYLNVDRRMMAPTHPGDTIQITQTVVDARPSNSRPDNGIVALQVTTHKHDGGIVQQGKDILLVRRRPA